MVHPVSGVVRAPSAEGTAGAARSQGGDFGSRLLEALQRLDAAQREADALAVGFATGQTDDVAQVILAGERARLYLQLAAAVRDRVVESVKELLRTPL